MSQRRNAELTWGDLIVAIRRGHSFYTDLYRSGAPGTGIVPRIVSDLLSRNAARFGEHSRDLLIDEDLSSDKPAGDLT